MAAITYSDILTRQEAIHRSQTGAICIVSKPDATDDATASVYLVKDPQGLEATTAANVRGGAKDGWKSYSHADLGTAYGV